MNSPSWKEISAEGQKLLERIGHAIFDLTWDSCRYLRDIEVVEVAARLYWALIRFSALNRLSRLRAQFLERAGQCREICNELRDGKMGQRDSGVNAGLVAIKTLNKVETNSPSLTLNRPRPASHC
jgi:hypothetical protein